MSTPENKTALVTGASSGIGEAISAELLEDGYRVIGIARDFGKSCLDHEQFVPLSVDLSQLHTLPDRLEKLARDEPNIDSVICCAGSGRFGSLEEFSYAQISALLDLNLTSQIFLARALLPAMKRRATGDIVFIGSEAAVSGGKRGAVYSAAKFGLRGVAQSLRQECASSGIRVSLINPGMVKTAFFDQLDFRPGDDADNYILPQDVASAVLCVLHSRPGTVFDEINLSPQKKVVRFSKPDKH